MEKIIEQKQEQINTIFVANQKVKIDYGFYKDKIGIIKKVYEKSIVELVNNKPITTKEIYYELEISLNDRLQRIELKEVHLLPIKKYKPFPLNLMS